LMKWQLEYFSHVTLCIVKNHCNFDTFTKRILYKTYTHTAYTNEMYTHAAYTVTKRILNKMYTEHRIPNFLYLVFRTLYSTVTLKIVLIEKNFLWRPQLEPHCQVALAAAKFNLTIHLT
jgi:hypothetical protein